MPPPTFTSLAEALAKAVASIEAWEEAAAREKREAAAREEALREAAAREKLEAAAREEALLEQIAQASNQNRRCSLVCALM